jgi:hypothetical protein
MARRPAPRVHCEQLMDSLLLLIFALRLICAVSNEYVLLSLPCTFLFSDGLGFEFFFFFFGDH